ncbi:hypothetical protein CL631_02305 [bacterium]|nr:hypothetical protein [bacterium]|tara:strand:+ start:503 stop:739 length:237 start_codon:yes stop_codon:yes gene_type:complete
MKENFSRSKKWDHTVRLLALDFKAVVNPPSEEDYREAEKVLRGLEVYKPSLSPKQREFEIKYLALAGVRLGKCISGNS